MIGHQFVGVVGVVERVVVAVGVRRRPGAAAGVVRISASPESADGRRSFVAGVLGSGDPLVRAVCAELLEGREAYRLAVLGVGQRGVVQGSPISRVDVPLVALQ